MKQITLFERVRRAMFPRGACLLHRVCNGPPNREERRTVRRKRPSGTPGGQDINAYERRVYKRGIVPASLATLTTLSLRGDNGNHTNAWAPSREYPSGPNGTGEGYHSTPGKLIIVLIICTVVVAIKAVLKEHKGIKSDTNKGSKWYE